MKDIELWQGDCLTLLEQIPDKSVDLVLTDPPYNVSRKNNFKTMGRNGIDFGDWDYSFDQLGWIENITSKVSNNGSVIIFNDWKNLGDIAKHLEENGFVVKDILRWVKDNPMPRNRDRRYIMDAEYAVWAVKKKSKWTFNRLNKNYDRPELNYPIVAGKEKTTHPTQKPIKLMEELIKRHSNVGNTVLDNFMGSGTTGVACKNLNRKFIGIELDGTYFNLAKERIESVGEIDERS